MKGSEYLSSLRGIYSCVDFEMESFQLLTCDCHLQRNQASISNHMSQLVEARLGISSIEEEKPQMLSSRNILVAGLGVLMLMYVSFLPSVYMRPGFCG
jgi:hypothetical protein